MGLEDNVVPRQSLVALDRWMERYQQADPKAVFVGDGAFLRPRFKQERPHLGGGRLQHVWKHMESCRGKGNTIGARL